MLKASVNATLVLCALTGAAASAEPTSYVSVSGGHLFGSSSNLKGEDEGATLAMDLELDAGGVGAFAVGYGDGLGLRGEVELGYRKVDVDALKNVTFGFAGTVPVPIPGTFPVDGDFSTLSLMLNGMYVVEAEKVLPYFGAGLGVARHNGTVGETSGDTLETERANDSDTVFAYQALVGVFIPIEGDMEARVGYRYFGSSDFDFDGVSIEYGAHHSLEVGLLIRF